MSVQEGDQGGLVDGPSVRGFFELAAAALPVPGGGGIAAVVGAAGVSMIEMALSFTVGKPKFAAVEERVQALLAEACAGRKRLMDLVDEDAAGYGKVSAALKMPGKSPEEKAARKAAMQAAMREAIKPPLEMIAVMARIAALAGEVLAIANPNLASDTAVAASILPGAARAAALNVWMNVGALGPQEASRVTAEVSGMLGAIGQSCGAVSREVEARLCPRNGQESSSQ